MRCRRILSIALASVALSACVAIPYPVYKTLSPKAEVTVVNQAGRPVDRAEVWLITHSYPGYSGEVSREMRRTYNNGRIRFPARREWRIEFVFLHGRTFFQWDWCVRADGYATYDTMRGIETFEGDRLVRVEPIKFERDILVRLEPGVSTPCPGTDE